MAEFQVSDIVEVRADHPLHGWAGRRVLIVAREHGNRWVVANHIGRRTSGKVVEA